MAGILLPCLALLTVALGVWLLTVAGLPPLTPEELEAWKARHPLAPPPERPPERPGLRQALRRWLVVASMGLAAVCLWRAWGRPVLGYLYVGGAAGALIWAAACIATARLRMRGEKLLPLELSRQSGPGDGRHAGRRWEILDLYCERLTGEASTGLPSTRDDLARRARPLFHSEEDLEFLRRLRADSRSPAYRHAAAQLLEDLGSLGSS